MDGITSYRITPEIPENKYWNETTLTIMSIEPHAGSGTHVISVEAITFVHQDLLSKHLQIQPIALA